MDVTDTFNTVLMCAAVSRRRTLDRGSVNHKQSTSNQSVENGMHRADAAGQLRRLSHKRKKKGELGFRDRDGGKGLASLAAL